MRRKSSRRVASKEEEMGSVAPGAVAEATKGMRSAMDTRRKSP